MQETFVVGSTCGAAVHRQAEGCHIAQFLVLVLRSRAVRPRVHHRFRGDSRS